MKSTATAAAAAAAMGRNNPYIDAYTPNLLLVLSPLPLVPRDSAATHNAATAGAAYLTEAFSGPRYGGEELARLLDTLAAWLEADPTPAEVMGSAATWDGWADASVPAGAAKRKGSAADRDSVAASRRREVVIVCATAGSSFSTTVRCRPRKTDYDLDEQEEGDEEAGADRPSLADGGDGASGAREVVITQLCVGPLVALPVDDTLPSPAPAPAPASGDGSSAEGRVDSYLFSSARKFIVTHHAAPAAVGTGAQAGAAGGHWLAGAVRHAPTCAIVEVERTVRTYQVTDPRAPASQPQPTPPQPQQNSNGNSNSNGNGNGNGTYSELAVATVRTYARLAGRADVELLTMRRSQLSGGTWLQVRRGRPGPPGGAKVRHLVPHRHTHFHTHSLPLTPTHFHAHSLLHTPLPPTHFHSHTHTHSHPPSVPAPVPVLL